MAFLDITQACTAPRSLVQNQETPSACILENIIIISNRETLSSKIQRRNYSLKKNEAGAMQGTVLGPVLCLVYKSDFPTSDNTTTVTFAAAAAILAIHEDPAIASMELLTTNNKIDGWSKKWRNKTNQKQIHAYYIHPTQPNLSESANGKSCFTPIKHLDRRLT